MDPHFFCTYICAMFLDWGLFGLFVICFISSTIIPFPSEAAVIYFLTTDESAFLVLTIATLGNSLGGSTNYFLGKFGRKFTSKKHPRAERFVQRFGVWSALFAWLPFIGDPLMLVLGFYRTAMSMTFLLMTLGKFLRYLILFFLMDAI